MPTKLENLPVWNWRTKIGEAKTEKQARRVITNCIGKPARGFYLHVWQRPLIVQEINDMPAGWVYATTNVPQK